MYALIQTDIPDEAFIKGWIIAADLFDLSMRAFPAGPEVGRAIQRLDEGPPLKRGKYELIAEDGFAIAGYVLLVE